MLREFKKHWIALWLAVVTLILVTVFSYAAYTGVTTAKRVVSLESHDGILFTSKYMAKSVEGVKPLLFNYDENKSDEQNVPILMVDVCNYDSTDSVYGKNFKFKIKARLVHADGSDITAAQWTELGENLPQYSVAYSSYSDETEDLTESYIKSVLNLTYADQYLGGGTGTQYQFLAGDKTKYMFEVKFDVLDVKTSRFLYAIRMEAEPVENHGDLANLYGYMAAMKSGSSLESKWEGDYGDITEGRIPADYDGLNYQISGNTQGILRLTYRSDILVMDTYDYGSFSFSQEAYVRTESGKTYTTLYIVVNSENKSRYDIRFYWLNGKRNDVLFDDSLIKAEF